jgi:hypothetical protein
MEREMSNEGLTLKDYVIGCALALKCYHIADGICSDKECTICPMLTKVGELLVDGTLDSDLKAKVLQSKLTIAEERLKECEAALSHYKYLYDAVSDPAVAYFKKWGGK